MIIQIIIIIGSVPTYQNYSNGNKVGKEYKEKKYIKSKEAYFSKDLSLPSTLINPKSKKNINGGKSVKTKDCLKDVKNVGNVYVSAGVVSLNNAKLTNKTIQILNKIDGQLTPKKKAEALFNWTRDKIGYQYYTLTRKKATGALSSGKANCADQSHLLVWMYRKVGIPAEYINCMSTTFRSRAISGHVWVAAYIGNKWYDKIDTVSKSNKLTKTVNMVSCANHYLMTNLNC